jgi:hypothetical protein
MRCILTPEMIEPGMHLNAVGGDCPGKTELHADILRRPDARIVVEFEPQARIEGEIQQLDAAARVIELADVVSGKLPGRLGPAEVSIFDSVGFALNDFSSLRYLHRLEREHAAGVSSTSSRARRSEGSVRRAQARQLHRNSPGRRARRERWHERRRHARRASSARRPTWARAIAAPRWVRRRCASRVSFPRSRRAASTCATAAT